MVKFLFSKVFGKVRVSDRLKRLRKADYKLNNTGNCGIIFEIKTFTGRPFVTSNFIAVIKQLYGAFGFNCLYNYYFFFSYSYLLLVITY